MPSIAAREADIVGINLSDTTGGTDDRMEERIRWVREAARNRRDALAAQLRRHNSQGLIS